MLNFINLAIGVGLLVAGRRLFWLFVGAAGFVTGLQLASRLPQSSEGLVIIVGLVIGILFALLAIFLQRLAIAAAGFLAGGYILTTLVSMSGLDSGASVWLTYIVGGIIGLILVSLLFSWALITLSSLAGAALIVQSLFPDSPTGGLIFIIVFVIGVVIQGAVLRYERRGMRRR